MEKQFPLQPFNLEAYKTGVYTLVYRSGEPVKHVQFVDVEHASHPLVTVMDDNRTWSHLPNGCVYYVGESVNDVFMVERLKQWYLVLDASNGELPEMPYFQDLEIATMYANQQPTRVVVDGNQLWLSMLAKKIA